MATCLAHFLSLLEDCIQSKSLTLGKLIHQHLLKNSILLQNNVVSDKLTHLYLTCNSTRNARHLFDKTAQRTRNVVIWNQLIRAYAWNGPFDESIDLYYEMLESGIQPTKYTFPFVLKACASLRAIEDGREIHGHAKSLQLDTDVYVSTALVDVYAKCGCLYEAKEVFDEMPLRDVVAWNSMIAGFSLHGDCYNEAIDLVVQMQKDRICPNPSTVVGILPAVGQAKALRQGKAMHCFSMRRSWSDDVVLGTGLLDMYGKCQCIIYARRIFDRMGSVHNEVTWSAMIGAYVACNFMTEATELFHRMMMLEDDKIIVASAVTLATVLRTCAKLTDLGVGRRLHCYTIKSGLVLDLVVGNTLLSMYAKCGVVDDAMRLFDKMKLKDAVSFSAIISGCVQNGNAEEALCMFRHMQLCGMIPDSATIISILSACSHLAALQHGCRSHGYAIVRGFTSDTTICNALIDMYAKCGRIDTARDVFNRMDKRDIVSWNTMIMGYGIHGLGVDALSLFNSMQAEGLKADDVTFICLLSACSHSGLVMEGKFWFNAMSQDFHIIPRMEHYVCMADLLGRAGLFEEVHKFIENMPFKPDLHVWGALLAACRVHKNVELGEEVSKKIQRLGPESARNFVMLSNIYSSARRWDDAAQVRIVQRDLGFKKSPGCSWIEISGVVHAFVGGDRSHPESEQIHNKLQELLVEMKRLGPC